MTITSNNVKIFSFFSGSGFLDLGFEKSGCTIEFVNEFHEPFSSAYTYAREQMKLKKSNYGLFNCDVKDFLRNKKDKLKEYIVDAKRSGNIVGFIGGPPCPDFSIAGKNMGKDGENGKLSKSYIDLIIEQKPDFFLFENVKGLWKTAVHRAFFEELKHELHIAGYATTEHLANALEFGVPQDRDRIFLFGILKDNMSQGDILESEISEFPWNTYKRFSKQDVKQLPWPEISPFVENGDLGIPSGIIRELTVEYWFKHNDVLSHPNAKDFFTPRSGIVRMQTVSEGDVSRKSYKRLHRWRFSPTVAYGNNEVHLHPYFVRRISAAEAMALQSLPADFILPPSMSLSNKFKTIGNGVPFLLAEGIAKTIQEYLIKTII